MVRGPPVAPAVGVAVAGGPAPAAGPGAPLSAVPGTVESVAMRSVAPPKESLRLSSRPRCLQLGPA